MIFKEKVLFHQVHPAKLGTDIAAAIVSLYFFWQHDLLAGIITHFVPPPIASFAVMRFVDLAPYKNSRLGVYLSRHMTRAAKVSPSQGVSLRSSRLGTLTTRDRGWTCALRSSSHKIINVSFHTCPVPADAEECVLRKRLAGMMRRIELARCRRIHTCAPYSNQRRGRRCTRARRIQPRGDKRLTAGVTEHVPRPPGCCATVR